MKHLKRLVSILLAIALAIGLFLVGRQAVRSVGNLLAHQSGTPTDSASGGIFGTGGLIGGVVEALQPVTGEDEILALLMRQDIGEQRRLGDQLDTLVQRRDATGYYANLYQALVRAAEGGDAAACYRTALALSDSAAVRHQLADALLAQGDRAGALTAYVSLLPDEEALAQVLALEPDPVAACRILLAKSMWDKALSVIETARAQSPNTEAAPVLSALEAVATAQAGRYAEALPLFEALPEAARTPAAYEPGREAPATTIAALALSFDAPTNVAWWHARSLEATEQTDKAITAWQALGPNGGERLGTLLEAKNQLAAAAAAYLSAPAATGKWQGAKLSEQLGEKKKAVAAYLEIASGKSRLADDAAYRAYLLLKRQKQADGEDAQRCLDILKASPSWMTRLDEERIWPETVPGSPVRPAWLDRVERFEANSQMELSKLELAIGSKETTPGEKLYLARWYLDRDDLYTSVVWGMRALKEEPSVAAYRFAYPRAFSDAVDKAAAEFNVDPLLIWAIMRTESTYRAEVLSRSGAIGLMQIMPATGQDIAGRLKATITDEDLKNPDINVRFGAFYVGAMIKQFEGDWDKALAAYNGGPGNVRKWSKSPLLTRAEDFPTVIRYEESREYITKVMDAYWHYKWMEEDARFR